MRRLRIPVATILGMVADGMDEEEVVASGWSQDHAAPEGCGD